MAISGARDTYVVLVHLNLTIEAETEEDAVAIVRGRLAEMRVPRADIVDVEVIG